MATTAEDMGFNSTRGQGDELTTDVAHRTDRENHDVVMIADACGIAVTCAMQHEQHATRQTRESQARGESWLLSPQ